MGDTTENAKPPRRREDDPGRYDEEQLPRDEEDGGDEEMPRVHLTRERILLLVLFVVALGVASLGGILLGVAVFSLGVVAGMILFAVSLNYPMLRWGQGPVRRVVNTAVAVISIAYALLLFAGFGGFNPLPSPVR